MSFIRKSPKNRSRPSSFSAPLMESLDRRVLLSADVISVSPTQVNATEGQAASSVNVATFTDSNASNASDFTATVTWGDGAVDQNVPVVLDNNGNFYDVLDSHTYLHAGSKTIGVTITNGSTSSSGSANSSATVANAALTATSVSLNALEGTALANTSVLAKFTDANASASASDFAATITWASGVTTAGTVAADPNGGFDVISSHRYDTSGDKPVTVIINGMGGGVAQASSTVHVTDAAIKATGAVLKHRDNRTFSRFIATVTDSNPFSTTDDFSAYVYVGMRRFRCTVTSFGNGQYAIGGTLNFAKIGQHALRVLVLDHAGNSVTASTKITVY